jgi:hypothetical protein
VFGEVEEDASVRVLIDEPSSKHTFESISSFFHEEMMKK